MPTDLEAAIRDALRADDISAEQLIHPTLRAPTPRRPVHRFAAVAAAVVAVAVVATGTILVTGNRGRDQAGANPLAGVIGYRWRVTQFSDGQGPASASNFPDAQIGFTRDGYVLGNDTVNALQGQYEATSGGYTVHHGGGTLAGYAGNDPLRTRLISAVDVMFLTIANSPGQTPPPPTVEVTLAGGTLTLRHDGTTLTLERDGAQPDFFAQRPSSTATAVIGRIRGRLLISPALTKPHPASGTIVISGRSHLTTLAGRDGRFSITLPAGRYTVIGHTPLFGSGRGNCITQTGPTIVTAGATVHVTVTCLEK